MLIPAGKPGAEARIAGGEEFPQIKGFARFYSAAQGVIVTAEVWGLPENGSGFFAFHIHEGDSCTEKNFADTGAHYNPNNQIHPKHAGDLPPLLSNHGRAFLAVQTDRFSIADVIGRTVVIHDHADDFQTQPSGNAGKKIACGVIHMR